MATQATLSVGESRVNGFVAQVYMLMGLGLIVTAVVSVWVSNNLNLLLQLNANPWIAFGLFIVQIVFVVAIVGSVMRLSQEIAMLLLLAYSAFTGLTIFSIFLPYSTEMIASMFWIAAGTFLLLRWAGLVIKRDLTDAGNTVFMLLMNWLIAWVFSVIPFVELQLAAQFHWHRVVCWSCRL